MGSRVGESAMSTDHEPGIPGGETPPSTTGGTPAATDARFMGSPLFETDLLTGHEPEKAEGGLRVRTRLRLRRKPRFMESGLFEIDLLTDHEPGWEHQWLPIPKGLRPKARGCEERATPG